MKIGTVANLMVDRDTLCWSIRTIVCIATIPNRLNLRFRCSNRVQRDSSSDAAIQEIPSSVKRLDDMSNRRNDEFWDSMEANARNVEGSLIPANPDMRNSHNLELVVNASKNGWRGVIVVISSHDCVPKKLHRFSMAFTKQFSAKAFPTVQMPQITISTSEADESKAKNGDNAIFQKKIAEAILPYYKQQKPVVLRGAVIHAPAMHKWKDLVYLQRTLMESNDDGNIEIAQVEIGGSYATPGVERPEIPIDQYFHYLNLFEGQYGASGGDLDDDNIATEAIHNLPPSGELVYMAQNELPKSLYGDITVPELCHDASHGVGHGHLYQVMWWLGPRGCVSPLHYDPLDNLLMQFQGRKRFMCIDPSQNHTMWHYAGTQQQQSNTSPLDLEQAPCREAHPIFWEQAPPVQECILHPGDMLYIPAKWWHHVRSIDKSASVNIWWR